MFKKGDYIVILKGELDSASKAFIINNCYKQKKNSDFLSPELDSSGSTNNAFYAVNFNNINRSNIYTGKLHKWRFASNEEIDMYNFNNKPYDVTTLKLKLEVGKWYKTELGSYIKYSEESDNFYHASEYLLRDRNYIYTNEEGSFCKNQKLTLADLSEIQKYLPEGHVDKFNHNSIVGSFPIEGCVYDDLQKLEPLVKYLLNRPYNNADGKVSKTEAIGIGWNKTSCWWLKTNKSEKPKFNLSELQSFLSNNIAPEYLECIKSSTDYSIIGRIYKFKSFSGPHYAVTCNLKCDVYSPDIVLYFDKDQFKPSTKEAYEAQLNNSYDYVKCIVSSHLWKNRFIPGKIYKKNDISIESHINLVDELGKSITVSIKGITLSFVGSSKEEYEKQTYSSLISSSLEKLLKEYPLTPNESFPISKELTIPKIQKQKVKIDFDLSTSKIVPIQVNLTKKQTKQIKPIKIEKFNLTI